MSNVPKKLRIEAVELRNEWIARPAGSLGNVGNYPFPWTATYATSRINAINKFKQQYAKQIAAYEESSHE